MKCQIMFSGKNKKLSNLSSAVYANSTVRVQESERDSEN